MFGFLSITAEEGLTFSSVGVVRKAAERGNSSIGKATTIMSLRSIVRRYLRVRQQQRSCRTPRRSANLLPPVFLCAEALVSCDCTVIVCVTVSLL